MTTTTPVTSTPGTSTANGAPDAMAKLSGNFSTFLTLLTTQLKNQDPTSPMDSNQFTQQLVAFSQVEQQINTNSNLQTLINQGTTQSGAYATGYLGKSVTVPGGQGSLSNGEAKWDYTLASPASSTTLTVSNANGLVVYSGAGATNAGSNSFAWNGRDNNGNKLPDGPYMLAVGAQANGAKVTTSVSYTGQVREVDMTGGAPQLVIGSMQVGLSAIGNVQN